MIDNRELYGGRAYRQQNAVFVNKGGAQFAVAAVGGQDRTARAHRGCAFGDFDNDGRIDVAVSCLNEPAELLRNVSDPGQHWLQLRLRGTSSNRDGIGAKVKLVLESGRALYNHATTAVGYACSSSRRIHFGLGSLTRAARLEIRWPSGTVQVMENVNADRLLDITEPPGRR